MKGRGVWIPAQGRDDDGGGSAIPRKTAATDLAVQPSRQKYFTFVFSENVYGGTIPLRSDWRFAIVTNVGAGCDGLSVSQRAFRERTNDAGRTVKSRGPDLPVLRSSLRCDELADDGGNRAGPRGDRV